MEKRTDIIVGAWTQGRNPIFEYAARVIIWESNGKVRFSPCLDFRYKIDAKFAGGMASGGRGSFEEAEGEVLAWLQDK